MNEASPTSAVVVLGLWLVMCCTPCHTCLESLLWKQSSAALASMMPLLRLALAALCSDSLPYLKAVLRFLSRPCTFFFFHPGLCVGIDLDVLGHNDCVCTVLDVIQDCCGVLLQILVFKDIPVSGLKTVLQHLRNTIWTGSDSSQCDGSPLLEGDVCWT